MKLILGSIGVATVVIFIWVAASRYFEEREVVEVGDIQLLYPLVSRLVEAKDRQIYLTVGPVESSAFFHLSIRKNVVQVLYPLPDGDGGDEKDHVMRVGKRSGVALRMATGLDGTRMLDFALQRDPDEVTDTLELLLVRIFDTDDDSRYRYRHWGLPDGA